MPLAFSECSLDTASSFPGGTSSSRRDKYIKKNVINVNKRILYRHQF